jgi:hypothetical protein
MNADIAALEALDAHEYDEGLEVRAVTCRKQSRNRACRLTPIGDPAQAADRRRAFGDLCRGSALTRTRCAYEPPSRPQRRHCR